MTENLLGINIKKLRKHNNLTQKELADRIGARNLQVSRWENGEVIPDSYMIQRMSVLFNVPVEKLIRGIIILDDKLNMTEITED